MELSLAPRPKFIDPVCGMTVDPESAPASLTHNGQTYYFCNPSCKTKFEINPDRYLSGIRDSMTPDHSLSVALSTQKPQLGSTSGPKRYICPMDPEVVSDRPGSCPKCGMALELATPALDEGPDPELESMSRRFRWSLVFGIPVVLLAMLDMLPGTPITKTFGIQTSLILQTILTTIVVFWCGSPFFVRAWESLIIGSTNMFTLIVLGVIAAYLFSLVAVANTLFSLHLFPEDFSSHHGMVEPYFESAAAIIILVLLGQVLELRARHQTGGAIRELLKLTPKTARVILPDGREEELPIDLIQVGDHVRIRAGEQVPIDGIVKEGSSTIDESTLTGEPIPVEKQPGSNVSAGTLNGTGSLRVETQRVGADTLLSQIVHLVSEAQRSRIPIQKLVDKVSAWFVPMVIAISLVTFLLWAVVSTRPQRELYGLISAVAVLVIACPCALGLATPMAIIVGTGRSARKGILFRNAEALELLNRADTIVFDKTGTLTEGKPSVTMIEPAPGFQADEILRLAASIEKGSEHPLASAILQAAQEKNLSIPTATEVKINPGRGIRGKVKWDESPPEQTIFVGTHRFLEEEGVTGDPSRRHIQEIQENGQTAILIAINRRYAGVIGASDKIRPTTSEAIQSLKEDDLRLILMSGDNRTTAQAVANELHIDDVFAEVLPQDKHAHIQQLQREGRIVAMVGDGINDAPALAQANIGIAMGTGTDVAIASGGVTLIRPDLRTLIEARRLSRATLGTIRENLLLAFLYNALAIPVAAGVLTLFGGGVISPIWAAAAMSLSSVSVIGNSLRLK